MAEAQDNSTSPASNEVQWFTIFYTLIPLATSTMTQPVGSVLGTSPISRTYLRSSPFFCAFDALAFILQIPLYRIFLRRTFRGAVKATMEARFQDITDETESLEAFKGLSVMRWIFFLLGTHGSMFKLAGSKGLPWTQLWGLSFVASFVVLEGMIFIRRRLEPEIELRPVFDSSGFRKKAVQIPVILGFWAALLGNCLLVLYVVKDLSILVEQAKPEIVEERMRRNWLLPAIMESFYVDASAKWFGTAVLISITWILVFAMIPIRTMVEINYTPRFILCGFLALQIPSWLPGGYYSVLALRLSKGHSTFILYATLAQLAGIAIAFIPVIWIFAMSFPGAGEKLLLVDKQLADRLRRDQKRTRTETLDEVPLMRVWPLILFLTNFAICLLWYRLAYDPERTSSLSWAGVFG